MQFLDVVLILLKLFAALLAVMIPIIILFVLFGFLDVILSIPTKKELAEMEARDKEINERNRRNAISLSSDGKEYRNTLELSLMEGSVRFEGYSNVYHTLNSYKAWCDRIIFGGDGITLNYKDKTVFVPTKQVQRITVINEDMP